MLQKKIFLYDLRMFKITHISTSLICLFLLCFALFLQHFGWLGAHYPPCPLCIFQRIGFLGIGLCSLGAYSVKPLRKVFHLLAIVFAFAGLAVALRHAWVLSHPETSCGVDPLEIFINQFSIVQSLPFFFKADGFCSMPLPPVFYLSVPHWSLLFFSLFSIILTLQWFRIFLFKKSVDEY
jgi:disulfide bond formation protein DsbB